MLVLVLWIPAENTTISPPLPRPILNHLPGYAIAIQPSKHTLKASTAQNSTRFQGNPVGHHHGEQRGAGQPNRAIRFARGHPIARQSLRLSLPISKTVFPGPTRASCHFLTIPLTLSYIVNI
jgi:hypothetical protein